MIPIGIAAMGVYLPEQVETAADIAQQTGIPEHIVIEKLGIRRKHIASANDQPSQMASRAALQALANGQLAAEDIDLIVYHGSEYKDYVVWSAAARIQHRIGATRAWAYEIYALCAGTPVAIKVVSDQMRSDPNLRNVLLVSAARENDLVDPANQDTRFMLNFGAGGSALLLRRGSERNQILGSAVIVDGSFSEDVVMPAGGSLNPPTRETIEQGLHMLEVNHMEHMRERLGVVSLPNFIRVIDEAVVQSGATRSDISFLIITHMKRSFHKEIVETLGLQANQALYLEEYGHIQSVDQPLGLHLAAEQGLIHNGDLVVLAGAGTGYTWSATAIRWGK